ncbi:mitochondrial multi-RCC1 domain-containing protein [Andalucia godoyi]|nr:mitochondrial multi-RCC1 domain-containing protein [Andalucia godoyi]|eukprot:ANDGO_01243.mRNA.3 mitochondrial multi-RCC1 domain-containing protein
MRSVDFVEPVVQIERVFASPSSLIACSQDSIFVAGENNRSKLDVPVLSRIRKLRKSDFLSGRAAWSVPSHVAMTNDCGLWFSAEAQELFKTEMRNTDRIPLPKTRSSGIQSLVGAFSSAFLLSDDGSEVFGHGPNLQGQLGVGHMIPQSTFSKLEFPFPNAQQHRIVSIGVGQSHSIFVDDAHRVYGSGSSRNGQLGSLDGGVKNTVLPARLEALDGYGFYAAGAGASHSALLGRDGLFVIGGGSRTVASPLSALRHVPFLSASYPRLSRRAYLVCGSYHTLVVDPESKLAFATGLNSDGQLGLGDRDERTDRLSLIPLSTLQRARLDSFQSVCAGHSFSCIVS